MADGSKLLALDIAEDVIIEIPSIIREKFRQCDIVSGRENKQ